MNDQDIAPLQMVGRRRMVGYQGPEMEANGPARYFKAPDITSIELPSVGELMANILGQNPSMREALDDEGCGAFYGELWQRKIV